MLVSDFIMKNINHKSELHSLFMDELKKWDSSATTCCFYDTDVLETMLQYAKGKIGE